MPLIIPYCFAVQGFFTYLMMNFIQGIPRELDEAAKIDVYKRQEWKEAKGSSGVCTP